MSHAPHPTGYTGARVERREDDALLRGQGRFTDDIKLPGTLVACFVRSSYAHARIKSIDFSAARAMPGIIGVWAAADLKGLVADQRMPIWVPTMAMKRPLGYWPLARDEVTHVGEAVAVIVAESRALAEDAAEQVVVDYDELPAVVNCEQAMQVGGPVAHISASDNIAAELVFEYGDIDTAFASAAHTHREVLRIHRGACMAMECRAVLASWDGAAERLTMWSAGQTPHLIKNMLIEMLGMADDRVDVITPDVGGGFGPKGIIYPEECVLGALTRYLGRPVRWTEDRREHFIATTQERDQIWDMEVAFDTQGRLLGVRGSMLHDNGAHTPHGVVNPTISATTFPGPYRLPSYSLKVKSLYTNKPAVTPLRGAGRPQGVFAMERLMDRIAQKLGLDRAEVRERNFVEPKDMPYAVGVIFRDGSPAIYDSGDYPRCQAEALARIDYAGFSARREAASKHGRYLGIGLANYIEGTGLGPFETATARVLADGRFALAAGSSPQGQGHKTMLSQIAADALGVTMQDIEVTVGDTRAVRFGMGTFASRSTVTAGSAMLGAAQKLREKILHIGSHVLKEPVDSLTIAERCVVKRDEPSKRVPLNRLWHLANGMPGITVPPTWEPGLTVTEVFKPKQAAYANGCHAVEVEVDIETGHVQILRYVVAHDCGRIVNPLMVDGQIQGGVAHGIGNALFELMRYDGIGQPLTMTMADYLLPMAPNVPDVEIIHIESPSPNNPLGAKGAGEGGTIPGAAVIIAAVEDALSHFGVRISEAPILPEQICDLVDAARRVPA